MARDCLECLAHDDKAALELRRGEVRRQARALARLACPLRVCVQFTPPASQPRLAPRFIGTLAFNWKSRVLDVHNDRARIGLFPAQGSTALRGRESGARSARWRDRRDDVMSRNLDCILQCTMTPPARRAPTGWSQVFAWRSGLISLSILRKN